MGNEIRIICFMCVLILLPGCQNNKSQLTVESKDKNFNEIKSAKVKKIENLDEALKKARDAWSIGKIELAQAYYIKAYEAQPDNVEVLKEMAGVYDKLGNNNLLEVCYRLILEMQPNSQEIIENYGLLLIKQKKITEAKNLLKSAIEKTKNWKVYNGLGIILDIQGKHEDARFFYGKASLIQQNNPEILNNIGYSFYMEDKLEKAQGYFLWAIKSDNNFHKAFFNYALTLARQKKYVEALSIFSKVMSDSEANNNIGFVAMKNRDYKKAEFYLNQAIKLAPTFYKKAHQNLQDLHYLKSE